MFCVMFILYYFVVLLFMSFMKGALATPFFGVAEEVKSVVRQVLAL